MNYIELAKQAGLDWARGWTLEDDEPNRFEAFAALVEAAARVDEREACAKVCELHGPTLANGAMLADAIRARGQA